MDKKCIIIFSGFNQRAVIAFIRTLEKYQVEYGIIATSNEDTIFKTIYSLKVIVVRKLKSLDLNDIVNSINILKEKIKAKEYFIAPSTEGLNRFLLENRNVLEVDDVQIPLVSKEIYEKLSDKYSFGELCKNNKINVPGEYSDIKVTPNQFVAKPVQYFSTNGSTYPPILILSESDKTKFLTEYNTSDFYFQEFINGKSYYLLYYFHSSGNIYKFSQENIIQQPDGKSIVAAISSKIHLTEESSKFEQLFKSLNYNGFVMVELKKQEGVFYMIEANPRFWGPSQLFVDADMNFFVAFLYDLGLVENSPKFIEQNEIYRYFWFGGIIQSYKSNKPMKYHESNENELFNKLTEWIESDIYKRPDTQNIFKNEII